MNIKPHALRSMLSTTVLSVIGIINGIFLNRFGEHSETYLETEDSLASQYSKQENSETLSKETPEQAQEKSNQTDNTSNQNKIAQPKNQPTQNGGKNEQTNNNKPQSNSSNATAQTNNTTGTADNQQNVNQSDAASEVVRLCNIQRQQAGVPVLLNQNSKLQQASNIRCNEIKQNFSHTRPDGTTAYTVLSEVGVSYTMWGENIAFGQKTPEEVVNSWMNSPGHKANILNPNFTEIAVGMKDYYWVQIFIK